MNEKPTWRIYLNNSIAFLIFSILRLFFRKRNSKQKNILFINTGQIGDLMISSLVFSNEKTFPTSSAIYFLLKEEYQDLFSDYLGKIMIIPWNYRKYKFNLIYRILFIIKLRKLNLYYSINLTSARGITNDEIAILSGAERTICLNSNWRYLKKLFGGIMDNYYSDIIGSNISNEFEKHIKAIAHYYNMSLSNQTILPISDSRIKKIKYYLATNFLVDLDKIIIAICPFSDMKIKDWGLKQYKRLCEELTKNNDIQIILIGTEKQYYQLRNIEVINNKQIINTAGKFNILDSSVIVHLCEIFIGNDSGFTHIAKALKKNFVGIIGGGAYGAFFPYNPSTREIFLYHQMDCFGCEWRCMYPIPYCHQNVTVKQVIDSINELLNLDENP